MNNAFSVPSFLWHHEIGRTQETKNVYHTLESDREMQKYPIMIKKSIYVLMLMSSLVACKSSIEPESIALKTHQDSISYIIGYDYGEGIAGKEITISEPALIKGLLEGLTGKASLTDSTISSLVVRFQSEIDKKEDSLARQLIAQNKKEGLDYLEKNRTLEGVVELASGLQYKLIKEGQGRSPLISDSVKIHFRAMFLNGTTFDMSYDSGPAQLKPASMIKGLSEGIMLLKPGSICEFYIPWNLAYGEENFANVIPGGSTLRYHVELIEIL